MGGSEAVEVSEVATPRRKLSPQRQQLPPVPQPKRDDDVGGDVRQANGRERVGGDSLRIGTE